MNKIEFKKEALEKAKVAMQMRIDHLKEELDRIKAGEMIIDEGQYDLTQQSQDEAGREVVDVLADQLTFALEELRRLEIMEISDQPFQTIGPGAVVFTEWKNFFISTGIHEFRVNGKTLVGLHPEAPVYQNLIGKKTGDSFAFQGKIYRIEEVF